MPTIKTFPAFDRVLSIYQVLGEVQARVIKSMLAQTQASSTSPLHLWDFTHGSLAYEYNEGGRLLCSESPSHHSATTGKQTALVCPNELDHGLFRLVHAFGSAGNYPRQVRAFRCIRAAQRWLGACRLCRRMHTIQPDLGCAQQCSQT